jgi:hypothetical protein
MVCASGDAEAHRQLYVAAPRKVRRGWIKVLVIAAIVLIVCAIVSRASGKLLNIAGLLFDIAGALRLFLFEQIGESLRPFENRKKYPRGPPSVAMRELIMPEAGPYPIDSRQSAVAEFWYRNRGVVFLVFGFILQVIATLIG